ncbi:MAG: type IV toxin-antitoxin system AbiEi family antitoxin domain-containing protein [Patescibacteria group bacterium]
MYYKKLVQSGKTVFSMNDMRQIWGIKDADHLKVIVNRLYKRGDIRRIQKGVYTIAEEPNEWEIANKLKVPSYISLNTVLRENNIIFQEQGKTVTCVSNNTLTKKVDDRIFKYYKIKDDILFHNKGLIFGNNITFAEPERAVCDQIYLFPGFYFDNLGGIKKKRLRELAGIYNKRVQKEVDELIKDI